MVNFCILNLGELTYKLDTLPPYKNGGILSEIKQVTTTAFKSLREAIFNPDFVYIDKLDSQKTTLQLHLARLALWKYLAQFLSFFNLTILQSIHNMLPALHSKEDSSKCVTEARKLLANSTITQLYSAEDLINEPLIQKFCMYFQAELPGLEVPPNFF